MKLIYSLVFMTALSNLALAFEDHPLKDSIGQTESNQVIIQEVLKWGKANPKSIDLVLKKGTPERRKFLNQMNDWLKEQNLPPFKNLNQVEIEKTCAIGFAPNPKCFGGFELKEAGLRYCYPCMVNHNQFGFGVVPANAQLKFLNDPNEFIVIEDDWGMPKEKSKTQKKSNGRN